MKLRLSSVKKKKKKSRPVPLSSVTPYDDKSWILSFSHIPVLVSVSLFFVLLFVSAFFICVLSALIVCKNDMFVLLGVCLCVRVGRSIIRQIKLSACQQLSVVKTRRNCCFW